MHSVNSLFDLMLSVLLIISRCYFLPSKLRLHSLFYCTESLCYNFDLKHEVKMEIGKTINAERKSAIRKDDKYLHIMKYMGSKRELLVDIQAEVEKVLEEGDGILDIFAGTGSVGAYLKDKYNIVSNDIQNYSSVICEALISSSSRKNLNDISEAIPSLLKHFNKNRSKLQEMFPNTLDTSLEFCRIEKRGWTEKQRKEYVKFVESFASPLNDFNGNSLEQKNLSAMFFERNKKNNLFPYLQTTFLFSETYFSFSQAIDIDSIRYAIEKQFKDETLKNIALTALLYAHSYSSSSTGHFAMFRDLKDVKSINDTFLYRDRDVWGLFEKKLNEIIEFHTYTPKRKHCSYSMDYQELLQNNTIAKKFKLIYADPPYSFVHYSRFYHATESLVLYDYQIPEFKGKYRTDRHQSPFCQRQNVADAFTRLIEMAAENDKYVLLSYSDTGMISLDEILSIAKNANMKAILKTLNYDHSTLGRTAHKSNQIKEYLITLKPNPTN